MRMGALGAGTFQLSAGGLGPGPMSLNWASGHVGKSVPTHGGVAALFSHSFSLDTETRRNGDRGSGWLDGWVRCRGGRALKLIARHTYSEWIFALAALSQIHHRRAFNFRCYFP